MGAGGPVNPADNIPTPDGYELAEYREELLLSDGWARCEACGEVVASVVPVTDCGETLHVCKGCE